MGSPGRGIAGAKNDLKNSLDKFDDIDYTIEALMRQLHIQSCRYIGSSGSDSVAATRKGSSVTT